MERTRRPSSWRRAAGSVAAVTCLAGLFSGCRHRTPVLTPTAALQVMEADRRLNDRANSTLDIAVQDRHETGAAAQIDDAGFRQLQEAGQTAVPNQQMSSHPHAFVPLQYSYPAEFLGEWTESFPDGTHGTSLGLYVRPVLADPWRVTLYVYAPSDSPEPLPPLAVAKNGYARRLSPDEFARLGTSPSDLANDVAVYWNGYRNSQFVLPPTLASGGWTTARNSSARDDVANKAAQQKDEQFTTSPGLYQYDSSYRTRSGDALVFLSIVETTTLSVAAPLAFVSPLTYNGRQVLPASATQGAHETSVDVLYTVAAVEPLSGRPAHVIEGYWGPVAAARIG